MARSLGKSARILKSEAKADDGREQVLRPCDPPTPASSPPGAAHHPGGPVTDQLPPSPVTEPTDTTKR
ncbi:hypothetical protein GCM10023238_10370 [Streptomyces heliomycini]